MGPAQGDRLTGGRPSASSLDTVPRSVHVATAAHLHRCCGRRPLTLSKFQVLFHTFLTTRWPDSPYSTSLVAPPLLRVFGPSLSPIPPSTVPCLREAAASAVKCSWSWTTPPSLSVKASVSSHTPHTATQRPSAQPPASALYPCCVHHSSRIASALCVQATAPTVGCGPAAAPSPPS